MDVALLGGTGDIGEGLALRWAHDTDHRVLVGSRDAERAAERATDYRDAVEERGRSVRLEGASNEAAAREGDVVVAAVPPYHVRGVVDDLADAIGDAVLVNPAVGIESGDAGFEYNRPSAGSVTELVADVAPHPERVVGTYHSLPAGRLADLDDDLGMDALVVGAGEAKATVMSLTDEIAGLRAVDVGPLENAASVEALTPLLLTVKRYNEGLEDLGVRFV